MNSPEPAAEPEKPKRIDIATKSTHPMYAQAAETRDAVIGWMKNELSKGTERAYDLGKFLFTVSIGTAGLVATIMKDASSPDWFVAAIVLSAFSAIVALAMAWPKTWTLDGNTDLIEEYNDATKKNVISLVAWSAFYAAAFIVSVIAILTRTVGQR